jgi:taurine dioxygenase
MEVRRLGAALGAEVSGIDLAQTLTDSQLADIYRAFLDHQVVVFRDQRLTPEQHIAFSDCFGDIDVNVRSRFNKPGYPEIFVVSNIIENGQPIGVTDAGRYWHTDHCYVAEPSRCSLLYALEIPQQPGQSLGDTLFASTTAAFDTLPADLKQRLAGKRAINSYRYTYERKVSEFDRTPLAAEGRTAPPDIEHPVIRTHPDTGKPCIFVNEGYTTRILDMPEDESRRTLDLLFDHLQQPAHVYRHSWRLNDLLLWDNCATQHKAVFDYALPLRRRMERVTIRGSLPR